MANILVVDDDTAILTMIRRILEKDGYNVTTVSDSASVSGQKPERYDLILLDVMMPGKDGFALCEELRARVDCPILFLTARVESSDKIIGFQAGADDYIVKPFDLDELAARVAAHLRRERRRQESGSVRFFGELAIDYSGRSVMVGGEQVSLSRKEFDIVELLSLNAGQVFDRERIYERVWGIDGDGNSDTVMEHVRKIRAKLAGHTMHSYIDTVWGCGYKWNG